MNQREKFIYYSSPEHWFQTALELDGSIRELFESRSRYFYAQNYHLHENGSVKRLQNSRAIYLLMAYVLENLLKGILVLRNPELIASGKINPKIKTHELNTLSKELNFRNSASQKIFQEYVSNLCVAQGRYPIGKNEQNLLDQPNITDHNFIIYQTLFNRYVKKLTSEFTKNGWQSGMKNPKLSTEPGEFRFIINPLFKQ